ncbi:EF-hand calcium-binding domain-containing protein 8 [Apodemus sylvaticus]|uniref:EF-hand calcium-binding domain-containing protein 8 n=1 Tax=Apodemus sylvaticus TaxID=10129 RepID=UPI002243515E|nr:EF-hand calcium-binding domain-containing protein 8 [Apodemus sylvaticus]
MKNEQEEHKKGRGGKGRAEAVLLFLTGLGWMLAVESSGSMAQPGGSQHKETSRSFPVTNSVSQSSGIHQSAQQFSEMPLADLQKVFEKEADENGALKKEGFIRIMKGVLSSMSEEMLEVLFLKVDSDCNGFVTWQKYVDYMMREFQGKEEMRKSQYRLRFHLPMTVIPLHHGSEVVKVAFLTQRFKKMGCFLTVTKDGVLQFWSETFSMMESFRLTQTKQYGHQQMWVIDVAYLHNMNLIAVASTELKIEFFDISGYKCIRAFTFIDLDSCAMVMDYWTDYHKAVFCYGDTKGNAVIFISDNVAGGLFNPQILPRTSKWDHWITVSLRKLLNEKAPLYRSFRMKGLHPNWCQQVKYIPQLNVVVSCSAVEKSSLVLIILPVKEPEKPKLSSLNLRKGILCFDYCPDRNFLATGGYDPHIRLWNPLVSKRPVWLMKGHQTSVTHLLVNSRNASILISISRDKNIRVWDLQDYVCLQSFCGKLFPLGNCPITSAYFHRSSTLICSTYNIGILRGYLESQGPMKTGRMTTHNTPLCAVLYSKIFKQVVSGCLQGIVSVWDISTGKKKMELPVSGIQESELTTMALDQSERCLLTGLRDGTMQMWNYNTGECLMTFPNPDKVEISGIVHMNKVFYMTGWSKRITNFTFQKTTQALSCYHWQSFHTEDILSMDKYQNQFLGTSSYNGDIVFWNVSTSKPILSFNASKSPLPLQPKKVRDTEICQTKTPIRLDYEDQKWAHKPWKSTVSPVKRRLMSAPPVMKHLKDTEQERNMSQERYFMSHKPGLSKMLLDKSVRKPAFQKDTQKRKGDFWKKLLLQSSVSVEKIHFLQTRPRLPHTAALLSSCIDGFIYAWSIHGNGGLLGKFPVDPEDSGNVVGAMATDENDWILLTGDSKGNIKIWDIKDYCYFVGQQPLHSSRNSISVDTENKFRLLIPKQLRVHSEQHLSLEEKEVVEGQSISLVPPPLLITWSSHIDSVTDILYVDSFRLVVSASEDRDVKAWRLSGDTIGTFGLALWNRLQEAAVTDRLEQAASLEKKPDLTDATLKHSFLELDKELAEALVYQRREQAALMALLHGKAEKETEAWSRLHQMSLISPWTRESSVEDIEESWNRWIKDKQASKIVGAAYKPKVRVRNPKLLTSRAQFNWMRQQISPQIYQCLSFTDLTPIQQPDFLMHKILDQEGRHIRWVASDIRSDMESFRGQMVPDVAAGSSPAATHSSLSMVSVGQSPSNWSTSLKPLSSTSFLRPSSASPVHSSSSTPPQTLGLPRRGQRSQGQMLSPSCSIRTPGEPPSCPL